MPTTFASLEECKHYLHIDEAETGDDAFIGELIQSVTALFKRYTSRDILSASYTLTLDGKGGTRINLPQFPITAVASVTVDGLAVSATTDPLGYGFMFSERQVYFIGGVFTPGQRNVVIAYTAGLAEVPDDLKIACETQVGYWFKRAADRIAVKSIGLNVGQGSQTTTYIVDDLMPEVRTVLDFYKRRAP